MNILETDRLVLRKLTTDDASFILALLNDSDFLRFIGDRGVKTLADARDYILRGPVKSYRQFGFGLFLTQLTEGNVPIGICGLLQRDYLDDVDVGFAFLPQFRGQGYATESASAVIAFGKTHFGLRRIVATTQSDNANSIKVLEKLGLKFEQMIAIPGDDAEIKLFGAEV